MGTQTEALQIVRRILSSKVDPQRIVTCPAKTYMPISLDGLRYRPICRIYFKKQLYLGTISTRKVETRIPLKNLRDIEKYSGDLKKVVDKYLVMP